MGALKEQNEDLLARPRVELTRQHRPATIGYTYQTAFQRSPPSPFAGPESLKLNCHKKPHRTASTLSSRQLSFYCAKKSLEVLIARLAGPSERLGKPGLLYGRLASLVRCRSGLHYSYCVSIHPYANQPSNQSQHSAGSRK